MRPWLAYYTINDAFWKKYPPAGGQEYADQVFRDKADSAGKVLHYEFPTRADSLRWFAAMSPEVENEYIVLFLDFFDDHETRGQRRRLWVDPRQVHAHTLDRMRTKTPARYDVIQRKRNVWWTDTIDGLLAGRGSHLLVLGKTTSSASTAFPSSWHGETFPDRHRLGPAASLRSPAAAVRGTTVAREPPTRHPVEMRELRRVGKPCEVPAEVGALETVEDVVRWGLAQRPRWEVAGVVVQDEYCHDVLVRGPGPVFVCFDTT